jgi:hypothetical protein
MGAVHIGFALADPQAQGQYRAVVAAGVPVARMSALLLTALILGGGARRWLALGARLLLCPPKVIRDATDETR